MKCLGISFSWVFSNCLTLEGQG